MSRLVSRLRTRWRLLIVTAAVGLVWASSASAAANPLRLVGTTRLNARLEQLAFRTPAVRGITDVRILLPRGYAQHRKRRYPVLYLLHGALDDETAWTVKGDAEAITAPYPLIVVMPDSGTSGGYTNWYNGGRGGQPEWETYQIDQLIPWIDAHLRTRPIRAERATAGLSMGGFGAMSYAARHPDQFAAAGGFSGAVDTNNPLDIAVTPASVFGPRATEQVIWRAHDPWDLAANLRGISLTIRTGNGLPGGPFGPVGSDDIVEEAVHAMSVAFHARLLALHIPSIWDDYGPGGHDWPYWQRDLRQTLPTFMSVFDRPKPPPAAFTYTAVAPRYSVYDWTVSLRRRALEFSTLRVVGGGFSVTGSGRATITTPARYRPGGLLSVIVRDARGRAQCEIRVSRSGQVTITVSLGPSNGYQEYTAAAEDHRHRSVTASVRLLPLS
jgi:S-formylglutathione hydrolase FrmB